MIVLGRRTTRFAAGIVAALTTAFAQLAGGQAINREQQILETIEREQTRNGPSSEALIGPLSDLALLYRDTDDDTLAIAATERLLAVIRANDGIHSLGQVPVIEQLIAIEESHGDAVAAWDLEQRLLTLARRHRSDLRTVPIHRAAAEKRVEILARYQAGEDPPQIELGCYRGWPRGRFDDFGSIEPTTRRAGSRGDVARAVISDAQRNYAEAIAVLVKNEQYSSQELRELETELLDSVLLARAESPGSTTSVMTMIEPWQSWAAALGEIAVVTVPNQTGLPLVPGAPPDGWFDYRLGRESLVRLFAYELAAPAPLATQIEAFLRIADWDLLHSYNALASGEYAQVLRLLDERGLRSSIDALLSPTTPVVLPAHRPNPLATAESDAHIDVAFEITQLGEGRKIAIRSATADVTPANKDELVALIKSLRFRPRAQDGELARASPVTVRYYLD